MHIIVEKNIPFIHGLLEPYGTVEYLAPGEITAEAVRDADALFVRTRTRCDAALLDGSKCQFVATATIGTDHIDLAWCAAHGIDVANAPGCNAPAVAQYVFASLAQIVDKPIEEYRIGIVGVGHVGKIVEAWAREMGMKVLLNDPPRQAAEDGEGWKSLADIAREADIITFHTPLDDSTRHLADKEFFETLCRKPILINAARGPVVDNKALLDALRSGQVGHAVLDCWEDEPNISPTLLQACDIATPHIAGYSREGKVRGTRMALDAFSRHFGIPYIPMSLTAPSSGPNCAFGRVSFQAIAASYDPLKDTAALKNAYNLPTEFESLRNNYHLRTEF